MEGMGSLWRHQEGIDDLRHRLLSTTLELETIRTKAEEEMRRNQENIKQLVQLLQLISQQRDEARDQLQRLLSKGIVPIDASPVVSNQQPGSPMIRPNRGSSSITESDSLSDTHNLQSYTSSSMNSFLDPASSPDFSNINFADSCISSLPEAMNQFDSPIPIALPPAPTYNSDQASILIDHLVANKPLPEKGKLLQAVMEAGPLLKTLIVSGPLPQWRIPPPLQPLQAPPFTVKGYDGKIVHSNTIGKVNYLGQSYTDAFLLHDTNGATQVYPVSALNHTGVPGLCTRKSSLLSSCVVNYENFTGKRQKSH